MHNVVVVLHNTHAVHNCSFVCFHGVAQKQSIRLNQVCFSPMCTKSFPLFLSFFLTKSTESSNWLVHFQNTLCFYYFYMSLLPSPGTCLLVCGHKELQQTHIQRVMPGLRCLHTNLPASSQGALEGTGVCESGHACLILSPLPINTTLVNVLLGSLN